MKNRGKNNTHNGLLQEGNYPFSEVPIRTKNRLRRRMQTFSKGKKEGLKVETLARF